MPPFPGREEYRQMMTVHSTRNGVPPEGYSATGTPEPLPAGEPIPVAEPQPEPQPEPVPEPEEEHQPEAASEEDDNGEAEKKPRSHHKRR